MKKISMWISLLIIVFVGLILYLFGMDGNDVILGIIIISYFEYRIVKESLN